MLVAMETKNEVYTIIINFCQLAKVGEPVGHPLLKVYYVIFWEAFQSENPFEVLLFWDLINYQAWKVKLESAYFINVCFVKLQCIEVVKK